MTNFRTTSCAAALALGMAIGQSAHAQQSAESAKITTRSLNTPSAVSADSLGAYVLVRALSNGAVLVNDVQGKRVVHFDASLTTARVVMDSAATSPALGTIALTPQQLIAYTGDSTLFIDMSSMSLLVLGPEGNVARVMAMPHPQDARFMSQGQAFGLAKVDNKGRLVYRTMVINLPKPGDPTAPGASQFRLPEQPDSGTIVRADFDARTVDTVTTLKAFKPGKTTVAPDKDGNVVINIEVNPLDAGDEWTMLADGTIAIVRAHDYHVDWLDPDGTKRSSPKMPFDWKRLTDEQKQFKVDSIRPEMEKQMAASPMANMTIPTPNGPRKLIMKMDIVPANKLADYEPPVSAGSVKADLDNNLWIVPRTAVPGGDGGLRYDVVNRKGELFQRVQFPKGRVLVGFGPNGAIYTLNVVGKKAVLERTTVK